MALFILLAGFPGSLSAGENRILIIQDELPQMEVLAEFLENRGGFSVEIVDQRHVPESLAVYQAVIVFIHGKVLEPAEVAFIEYTREGGCCICLHHTISRSHGANRYLFDFMGIDLKTGPAEEGGYEWREGETLELVNLNPRHYITSHEVEWGAPVSYTSSDQPAAPIMAPSIVLPDTEVYLNHGFRDGREKTVLAGFIFKDEANGRVYMQDRGAWFKPFGQGFLFYMQPGHSAADYGNPNIAQMILNAIVWGGEQTGGSR
jgi:hypothetical protein